MQVVPATHAVAPVQPVPPHWPYFCTVPIAVELALALELVAEGVEALEALVVGAAGIDDAVWVGADPAPGGAVVGRVSGPAAVFHVAAAG